jgi:hypothetical protein
MSPSLTEQVELLTTLHTRPPPWPGMSILMMPNNRSRYNIRCSKFPIKGFLKHPPNTSFHEHAPLHRNGLASWRRVRIASSTGITPSRCMLSSTWPSAMRIKRSRYALPSHRRFPISSVGLISSLQKRGRTRRIQAFRGALTLFRCFSINPGEAMQRNDQSRYNSKADSSQTASQLLSSPVVARHGNEHTMTSLLMSYSLMRRSTRRHIRH